MRSTFLHLIPASFALLLASCATGPPPEQTQMLKDHTAMMAADSAEQAMQKAREDAVTAMFKMYESGSTEGLENYMAEGFVDHTPPPGMEVKGMQGFKDMMATMIKGWSNNKVSIHSMAHQGDNVFVHYNWAGDNTGEMMGMPATNKSIDVAGVEIFKFDGAKATEHWGYFEEMKMMTQLGLMPDPAAAPKKK